jgi:hypothetical protein
MYRNSEVFENLNFLLKNIGVLMTNSERIYNTKFQIKEDGVKRQPRREHPYRDYDIMQAELERDCAKEIGYWFTTSLVPITKNEDPQYIPMSVLTESWSRWFYALGLIYCFQPRRGPQHKPSTRLRPWGKIKLIAWLRSQGANLIVSQSGKIMLTGYRMIEPAPPARHSDEFEL